MRFTPLLVALPLALPAIAQLPRTNLPSGSPLGATPIEIAPDAALIEAQRAQQLRAAARARAARQQAMADAFAPGPTPAAADEPMRTVPAPPTYGQTIGPDVQARAAAPSPYGGYYQIRTPWDPR